MKAVKFLGHGKLAVQTVPDPTPDDQSIIIKVRASGICGSELHGFQGDVAHMGAAINGGHEVAGEVAWAPKGSPFKPGMRVGARVVQGCGECNWCLQGDETACANKRYDAADGHAELFKLGLRGVHLLPDDVEWPAAVVLSGDGLGVPVRAARRLGDTAGKKVLVLGLGPVGLSNVVVQAFRGADVCGADISPYRVDLARQLGASLSVNLASEPLAPRVAEWTGGHGADVVILCVARPDSLAQAFELVRRHGTVFQVAELAEANLKLGDYFLRKEAYLTGSWYYTSSDWPLMLQLHRAGLPYAKLVTHVLPLDQAQEGYDRFIQGQTGKVILRES